MGEATLQSNGNGSLALAGVLDFSSVPAVWPQLQQQIAAGKALELSLSGVISANSAALAMLLEARHQAAEQGIGLRFTGLPQGLVDLATLSNADGLLEGTSQHS
jgi:phospholipid transport system transporter-binding protein